MGPRPGRRAWCCSVIRRFGAGDELGTDGADLLGQLARQNHRQITHVVTDIGFGHYAFDQTGLRAYDLGGEEKLVT